MKDLKLVVVESPFSGDVEKNLAYVRAAMHDCLKRDEAPFAFHALYTQPGVLDNNISEERDLGIDAGFEWSLYAETIVFYIDRGWSSGMKAALERAQFFQRQGKVTIRTRSLGYPWSDLQPSDAEVS